MCARELEAEQNCNILTSTLLAVTVFLSRSPGCSTEGLGHVLIPCIFSPTATAQSRGPEGPLCWVLAFSTTSCLQLIWSPIDWISCVLSYIIVQHPPSSCGRHNFALIQLVHGQRYNILIFPDQMHLLFTQVHFLFWQLSRVGGQYTTNLVKI